MLDAITIAHDLHAYGLGTVPWIPGRGTGNDRRQIGGGKPRPLVRVVDVVTFRDKFPTADAILAGGTSLRVKQQTRIRAAVEKDAQISDAELVVKQVAGMLGDRGGYAAPTIEQLPVETLVAELQRRGLSDTQIAALLE